MRRNAFQGLCSTVSLHVVWRFAPAPPMTFSLALHLIATSGFRRGQKRKGSWNAPNAIKHVVFDVAPSLGMLVWVAVASTPRPISKVSSALVAVSACAKLIRETAIKRCAVAAPNFVSVAAPS